MIIVHFWETNEWQQLDLSLVSGTPLYCALATMAMVPSSWMASGCQVTFASWYSVLPQLLAIRDRCFPFVTGVAIRDGYCHHLWQVSSSSCQSPATYVAETLVPRVSPSTFPTVSRSGRQNRRSYPRVKDDLLQQLLSIWIKSSRENWGARNFTSSMEKFYRNGMILPWYLVKIVAGRNHPHLRMIVWFISFLISGRSCPVLWSPIKEAVPQIIQWSRATKSSPMLPELGKSQLSKAEIKRVTKTS